MEAERYARSAVLLHWTIALLLLFQLGLGWHMAGVVQDGTKYSAFQFHKSVGVSILMLSLVRVAVRLMRRPPPPAIAAGPMSRLVTLVHAGLYGFMVGAPLTGWLVVSSTKVAIPTRLFGIVPWPHLPVAKALNPAVSQGHAVIAWIGLGLIALHLAGAVRHHLGAYRSNVIGRMIPAVGSAHGAPRAVPAALFATGVLALAFGSPWLIFPSGRRSAPPVTSAAARASTGTVLPRAVASSIATSETAPDAAEKPPLDEAKAQDEIAQPALWRVASGGRLGFTAQMGGSPIDGRYERWTADIRFAENALPRSSIVVRVPLLSVNTDNDERDQTLKGQDFFGDAGTATFRSDSIRHLTGDRYTARGTLNMNGITLPVTLRFTLHLAGDRADVTGSSELDRTAFHIGTGQWSATDQIAAMVAVDFRFHATRAP